MLCVCYLWVHNNLPQTQRLKTTINSKCFAQLLRVRSPGAAELGVLFGGWMGWGVSLMRPGVRIGQLTLANSRRPRLLPRGPRHTASWKVTK